MKVVIGVRVSHVFSHMLRLRTRLFEFFARLSHLLIIYNANIA